MDLQVLLRHKNQVDKLEIPITGNFGTITLCIYPASSNAMLFEEEDAVDFGESRWQLQEGCIYEYKIVANNGGTYQLSREDEIVSFSHSSQSAGTLKTGIYVGGLTLRIVDSNNQEVGIVGLEIKSVKLNYRADYHKMLEDITKTYVDLVLMQGSPVTQNMGIKHDAPQQTLYQRYAFLRSIVECSAFQEAINKIIANPVRKWEETTVKRNICNVKRLSRRNMQEIASSRDRIPVSNGVQMGLPQGLNSVPRTLTVVYKQDTLDNQENQFVKFVLRSFYSFCSELRSKKNANERLKREIDKTSDVLNGYLSTLFFKQVSMPTLLNLNSPVLQRKEGYREILQAWLMSNLAANLSWKGGDNIYEAEKRNVAALYEYWVFFKLLEVIGRVFEIKPKSIDELVKTDTDQINLDIQQGKTKMIEGSYDHGSRRLNVVFYYNRTFAHTTDCEKSGSWTMTMRPDYTLSLWPGEINMEQAEKEDLIVHIHFDAKYRVNKIDLGEEETTSEEQISEALFAEKNEQEEGIYKRADLLKMHAYKDAIRRTDGAYILYPGTYERIINEYQEILPGLGAFCMTPDPDKINNNLSSLEKFLGDVLKNMLDRTSQRERMSYYKNKVYGISSKLLEPLFKKMPESVGKNRDFLPDRTWVVVGALNNDNQLDWIINNEYYFFRIGAKVNLTSQLVSGRYLLLHIRGESKRFVKIVNEGPVVIRQSDLPQDYPLRKNQKQKNGDMYLRFRLDSKQTEKEWEQYEWDLNEITKNGKSISEPVRLSDLMRFAVKKE